MKSYKTIDKCYVGFYYVINELAAAELSDTEFEAASEAAYRVHETARDAIGLAVRSLHMWIEPSGDRVDASTAKRGLEDTAEWYELCDDDAELLDLPDGKVAHSVWFVAHREFPADHIEQLRQACTREFDRAAAQHAGSTVRYVKSSFVKKYSLCESGDYPQL